MKSPGICPAIFFAAAVALSIPPVAVLVLLARAARALFVAANLAPGRWVVRFALGRGLGRDAGAGQGLRAGLGQRQLVLAGRRVDVGDLHRRQLRYAVIRLP